MRLSELLRAEVLDARGERVGRVHDVRLVRNGPVQGGFGPAYRLHGLLVGAGSWGSRLGFDRGNVKAPLPLKLLFRWFHQDAKFVDWNLVQRIQGREIHLSVARADLPPIPPLVQTPPP
jgi:hypothetical protein